MILCAQFNQTKENAADPEELMGKCVTPGERLHFSFKLSFFVQYF